MREGKTTPTEGGALAKLWGRRHLSTEVSLSRLGLRFGLDLCRGPLKGLLVFALLVAAAGAALLSLGSEAQGRLSSGRELQSVAAAQDGPGTGCCDAKSLVAAGQETSGSPSLAVKLGPNARLVTDSDGTVTVISSGGSARSTQTTTQPVTLPLVQRDFLGWANLYVLEPAARSCSGDVSSDLGQLVDLLQGVPGVEWVELSTPLEACLVPNDPYYVPSSTKPVGQWGLARTHFPEAWDQTTGSSDVVVALLDTGLDQEVADFAGRIVAPYSVVDDSSSWPAWRDDQGHGTGVAGVAAAEGNNRQGIAGAAWHVGIMPVRISREGESDTTTLARAIVYAVDQGADVVNISFAGAQSTKTLTLAVEYALEKGVVVVAASGNDGADSVSYPAALPGVIAVGATDMSDALLADAQVTSNTGPDLDLVAPGKPILSYDARSSTSLSYYKGTSMAAPLVSGLVALMLSVNPDLTTKDVMQILADTADDLGDPGWDERFGWGIIDADEAVSRAVSLQLDTTTTEALSTTTTTSSSIPTTSTTSTTLPSTTTTTQTWFADVTPDRTPYWQEIQHLAALGVVSGRQGGLFEPEKPLMRQQFAKMIVLALGYPVTPQDACHFVDVAKSEGAELYPDHYVAVAWRHGIVQGTDSTHFSPYRDVTRAQMITMVARAADLPDPPEDYWPGFFAQQFPSLEHYANARRAAYAGLLNRLVGVGPSYDFGAAASRGEACAVLYALTR